MLYVVKIKGCKRCGGDLFLERDDDGVYIACLQCGAICITQDEAAKRDIHNIPSSSKTGRHYHRYGQVHIESR